MHKLRIKDVQKPKEFSLTLDGVQIKGLTSYSLERCIEPFAKLTLTLNVEMALGKDGQVLDVTDLSDELPRFQVVE